MATENLVQSDTCPNDVVVKTVSVYPYPGGDLCFITKAVFRKKVLNKFDASSEFRAGRNHQFLLDSWGQATEGNLIDEAEDAADDESS